MYDMSLYAITSKYHITVIWNGIFYISHQVNKIYFPVYFATHFCSLHTTVYAIMTAIYISVMRFYESLPVLISLT